jgi:hypothetical protein
VANKIGIKSFSNCFNEMKRLSGDALSDEKINQFLDEIKIKINEDKFREGEAKTEKILQKEIYDNFEFQQARDKVNIAENNIKALNWYQQITDAIDSTKGNKNPIDPILGVRAKLVGIQEFSSISRDSIGARQLTIEEVEIQNKH